MADFTPKDSPIDSTWTTKPSILPKDSSINSEWNVKNTPKEIPLPGYNFQNIDRYKRFIDEIYPNVDLERQAAANQSGLGKLGNMFTQGIIGEILNQGIIGGAGSIIGMPGAIYNGIAGKDADFNNFLTRFADNISEELQNKAPIFRYNPGKAFDWKDWGWWTSNGVSIFSTLGMMAPALGEAKLAGYFGKALKSVAEVSKLNKIRVADKALGAVSDIFDTEKYWQKLAHSSITMRNAENFREASQVYNDIRSEAFESFKNDEEYNKILNSEIGQEYLSQNGEPSKIGLANFIASQASWRNYSINAANVFFDAMQLAPIFKGFKIKTTENLAFTPSAIKNIQANILKTGEKFSAINAASFLKGSSLVIGEQLSEGAEELVNAIGQSEGSWYGKHLIGKEKDSNWGDRVSEYLHDPSAWEQAFWGFAGGMAFSAAARGVKNLQEAIYDMKDPHSISARQEEIINRYKLLGGVSDLLKKTMDGLNPYTSEKFKGSSEQIKDQQIETIKHLKKDMGYTLGLNAARSGNFTLLLNMLEHNNFKEEMIKLGIADEATFSEIHTNLLKDVKDAEKTYRDVYGKIFEGTTKKPWLREVILGNAVKTKGLIERFREGRDKYLNKLNDLKATNPAYASLIEKNKDKDLEGSIENIVYDNVISILEGQIKESKDEATKEVATTRLAQFKTELLSRKKELKDKEVKEGLNAISDIIETQIEVALYDTFLQEQNVAYENIVNTEKSIPILENKMKLATEETHRVQYETFKVKINEASKIDSTTSVEDIDKKIAELDSIITSLEDSKNDPYVTEDKPTKKLSSTWLKNYIESVKNRKLYLIQEKNRRDTIESQLKDREIKNTALVTRAQSLFKELGIKAEAKFTGKRSPDFNKTLESQLTTFVADKSQITFYPLLIDMISDTTQKVSDLSPEVQGAFTNVMNSTINALLEKNLTEEFINEILVLAGYITESELPSINTTELTKKADEFREAVENKDNIKAVLNFSTQNPLKKELVDFANAWITDIINRTTTPGEAPLFVEHMPDGTKPVKGTNIYFAPIAAKYGKLVGAERLIQDFDLLKLAYTIIRNSKVNPETGAKRNYNNDKTLKGITVEKIIATHNITSDFKDYEFYNNSLLSDTGGTGVANIYLPGINFNYEKDKDGNFIISDKERERFELLSSSLNENSEVTLSINTGLSGEKGFSLNKNNSDTIPIKVTTNIGGKEIFIGAINTIPTNHKGIKYNFKGEDWTDILLRDARNTNSNFDALERIYPALRNWYNNQKMKFEEQEIDSDLDAIAEADTFSLLPKLLGGLDMFSDEGRAALLHITKILFYGENTDGSTPIEFKRTNIINHLGQWKDKLYRDHLSNTKIRQALGTDIHRTITTKIKYITSGNVITTKDESGKPIYRSLTAIDSSDKIQLFIPNIQDDKKTLKNTRNSSDYIPKRTGISFGNPIYIGIKGRGTNETNQNIIPVPLKVNTIGGTLFESNNSKALLDEMMNLILKLGAARRANIEALRKNDTVGIGTAHKTQNEIVDTLAKVVNIDYSDQGHKSAIISNNSTFKFKSKDEQGRDIFVIYDWHNNKDTFKYERDLGNNTVASGELSKEAFTEHLSKLSRTIEYKFFGKKFTDILGNVYDSYEDYLISTNTIITDVGAVYDSKGNKISHFMPKTDNAAAGLPLIINIDTSTIQSKAPTLTKFNKFLSEYQLDARYNFAFNFFNELTKGDVKFNGISKARRKDPATGEYMLVYYDTTDKSINITPDWVDLYKNSPSSATLTLVHDIMHAVIGSRSKEEQAKLMSMLNEFRNDLLNTPEYKTLLQKADKTDIENKLITILNIKDPEEILTYGLTDTDFVKFLDTIKTTKNNITVSFWSRLKEIIREFAETLGITGTKVDELNDMFNQFMEGKLIETKEETTDDGNLDFFKKHGGLGHNLKGVSFDSTLSVLNKEQVIEGLIIHWHEEGREILREELAKLDKDEFNEEAKRAGFYSLGNYWTVHTVANLKASSFSSKVNTEITGSPFTIEEEYNVLNLMSNVFSQIVANKYKDIKLKETLPNEVRTSIIQGISDLVSERIENGSIDKSKIPFLKRVILTIRDNDDFWKYFKVHLSSQYGYNLNEIDEFTEDIESLQKAWDQTEVYTKNTLSTVSDQVKNFINSIYEIDPLNITRDDDGNIKYNKNLNTPTGFANTLSVAQYINKIIDLMRNKLTKEDMLNALLEYANANDTIFAATCYSIHSELSANPEILNAWFTTFSKSIKESYQDLYKTINIEGNNQTEINLVLGTQNSVAYHIANEWVDNIIARAENNYYTTEFIQKWDDLFIETRRLALAGFSKINDDVIDNIIKLYDMIGINIPRPIIMYNFRHDSSNFVTNIITPLLRIKGEPGKEDKDSKYIEQIVAGNTPIFNERGNLNRLADLVKYFREDHHNFSGLNTKGNLVTDIGNNSFLSNFFKKLDNAPEVVYDALFDYTKVISNQHSFLLWGDEYKDGVLNETNRGKGIFDYRIERGMKIPLDDKVSAINKTNLERFKYIRYSGSKDLNTNTGQEYSELSTFDWSLKKLIFYLGAGKVNREDTEHPVKESAVFSLLNPSDRKNTALFEVPIINVSNGDVINIVKSVNTKDFREVRNVPIFKTLYGTVIDELLAMQTAKELLFKLDQNGAIQFVDNEPVLNDNINPQLYYHYKLIDGKRHFLTFDENGNIDYEKSGNVFNPRTITLSHANSEFNFNNFRFNHRNFIQTLINSKDLRTALYSQNIPDDPKSTFANRIEELVANFIFTQIQLAEKDYSVYTETLQGAYIKRDNRNVEEKEFIFKGTDPITAYTEYLLNSFLFGIEQMRLFYGSVADYKSNIDINKRGGEVLVSGVQSILTGFYSGATISDVKLKSRVYEHMVATVKSILGHDTISIDVEKLSKVYTKKELRDNKIVVRGKEKTLFTDVEKEIYEITSPYLQNDSANATSFITFDEFVKRIDGFGLTTLYKDIIKKVKDGVKLDREELHKFASIQKNFYYSLDYNAELKKMVPTQVKNAEIVLTPALIKDLQLEVLNKVMVDNQISQVNLQSAEKVGSLYIATINDKDGNILEESVVVNELLKAKRNYTYENLHMQNEVTDSGYEERITLGRQISKKIIANLPDDHEYNVNGNKIAGRDLKKVLFALQGSNIVESANTVTMPFGVRIFKDGNVKGEIDYNKIIDYLEKEGINRNLSKNLIYGLKIGNSGYANLPLCFNTSTQRWENILTSLFTNEVNTQKFAGIHVPQMSSLFMNRKKAVKQSDLTSTEGINWHLDMFSKLNPEGKEVKRNDIKLQSNILYDPKEGAKIIKAQVLLARWASEFYEKGTFEGADGKRYIDINTLPEDVRTMVGYRVPTEAKYSMYVFEVVGFLPDDNGPAIVLPDDFITQTDSDFDFDTVFALAYNLKTVKDAEGNTKVERVTYNIDSSEAGKKARIEEILRDRHALTYILSREYEIDDIIKDLNKLNQLVSEYIETNEYIKTNFQTELNRIQELNAIIKESKGKDQNAISEKYELQARITTAPSNSEAYLYYKELPEYKKIYSKVETAIEGLDIEDQNTRKARENMIIDIYQAILTDPQHYLEQINPYKFKDITRVADEINSILNKDVSNINNLTVEGQNYYREKSIQGRSLKGISIALDRFNDIAQVAGIELTSHLREGKDVNPNVTLPTIKYKVPKTEVSRIKRDYKNDAVFEETKEGTFVTITHRYIANNPGNTYKNIIGKFINNYSAETTSNILDNVSNPLPENINSYTVSIWKMLVSLGSTYDVSTKFINQPIIRDLSDFFSKNINSVARGREIEEIKRKYQTLLYKVSIINGKEKNEYWDKSIAAGNSIKINGSPEIRDRQYRRLGYVNNKGITLTEDDLTNNLNAVTLVNGEYPELKDLTDTTRAQQIEDFLRYQLQILETFRHYKAYSDAVTDGSNILNTDKIGAGPTFNTTSALLYAIKRSNEIGILEIKGLSAMTAIFPKILNVPLESVYPTMEQYFIFSNWLSRSLFKEHFIGQSNVYQNIISRFNDYVTDKKLDSKLANTVTNYLNNLIISDLPWLNKHTLEDKRRILGINNKVDILLDITDTKDLDMISEFEKLSVVNQIALLKTTNLYSEKHLFNYLDVMGNLSDLQTKKNEFHKIVYKNAELADTMTQSFNDIWYSDNVLERIVARNLLVYEYLTNGFGYGYESFSKIIPNTIYAYGEEAYEDGIDYNEKGIGLSEHFYGKLNKTNKIDFEEKKRDERDKEYHNAALTLFNTDYFEKFIRANWTNDSIVPDAGKLTYYDNEIQREDGGKGGNIRHFKLDEETGIISIPVETFDNIATSRIKEKVNSSNIIKLNSIKDGEVVWTLYKRTDSYVDVDDSGKRTGHFYYYPIAKLSHSENGDRSVFPINNQLPNGSEILNEEEYNPIIAGLNKKDKVRDIIFKHSIAMNMTTNDGPFRPELSQYKTTLDLVRAGFRTATTRKESTHEAEKWALLKIGDYIKLQDTDEYIKVTKELHKIDLSNSIKAREEWSKLEGWDISYTHHKEDGIEFQDRDDLYQFEYIYIGTLENVMEDANAEMSGDGTLDEIGVNEIVNQIKSPKITVIPVKTIFSRESVQKDNDFIYLFTDNANRTSGSNPIPNNWYSNKYGKDKKYPSKTQAVIRGVENAFPITTMVDEHRTQWTDDKFNDYKYIIDDEIFEIKNAILLGEYKGIKYPEGTLYGKGSISNMKETAPKIWNYLNQKLKEIGIDNTGNTAKPVSNNIDLFNIKPSSYTSSIKPGVDFVFEQNPELTKIGTKQQYSTYLNSIFPNSKIKDIVYHGSSERREILDPSKQIRNRFGKGISFARTPELVKQLLGDNTIIHSALINLKNPLTNVPAYRDEVQPLVEKGNHDGVQVGNMEYTVPTSNQIHILGSKKDIEQFTNFVNLGIKPSSYTSSTSPSVNNAINSADQFTKKVYANLSNRVSRIKKEQVIGRKLSQLESTVKSLKELGIARDITELSLANLADALKVILGQFDFDLNRPKTDKDGGGIKIKLEEYINTDIQELINDPIKRKEFMNFMQRALSFLKGVRTFDTLESIDGEEYINEEKIINDLIKELQAMIPTINNVQTKYNNLLTKFYEADLRRFTSNPDILYGLRNIFDPSDDENYIQMQLDAMADTNNSFVALIVKKYTTLMTAADLESTKEIGDFEALLRKAFPGRNITDLSAADFYKYLEFKDGKPTARLIPKYDMDKYNAARDERMTYLAKKYGRTSQEFGRAARKWYEDNQVNNITPEELEEIIAKKKEDLPEWEFKDWKRRNMFTDTTNGKTYYKVADSNFATPSDKYINPAWTRVKDDPLYQKLVEIISNYTDHFGRATILNKGYIPTLTESDKDALSIREKWDKWVASKKYHQQSEQFVGENDEMVYILTVPMVEYFTQEEEIKISPRNKDELSKDYERRVIQEVREAGKGSFKSYEEIINKNREIRKANDEYHAGKINYNLYEVFSKFIREANRYKAKANMKRDVDLALYQNEISLFNKRDSRNRLLRNKTAGKALEKDVTGLTTGKGTNLEKHFAEWLEAVFYGNFDIDEGDWTKISKMLLQYTSAKNMWFNLTAGISNVAMGKLQIKLESNAGWYLKKENLNKADKMYIAAIPDMISNLGSTKSKSLTGAIIKLLDIAQNTNERDYTTGMLKKQLLSWSSAYFINDMGEHYMQNVNALAMMDHARIINGKIHSLADFSYKNYREALETILSPVEKEELARYEKVRYEREEFKQSKKDYLRDYILALPIEKRTAFVEAKKQIDATVTKDFETYPKVLDAFYLDNSGYAKLRDEIEVDGKKLNTKLTDQELAGFISKIKYVVRKQQGYYNQEDAGMVQRRGIGKMLIQFRKYMRPGWNKRFGSKFGKSYWTESRDEWDKGTYISLLHFLGTPIKRAKVENLTEAKTFYSMMGRILSDYGKMVTGTSLYWSTLDDFEKANIRRATSEMLYLSAVILAGFLLKKLKPEDDDDEFFAYDLTVYEIDRLMSELMMYTPIGLINEGQKILRSPAAVQGTMLDTYKLLTSLVSYPFQSDEARRYKTNIYSGDLKVKVNTIKMLPILNKLQQMKRLDKFNKYYILFRG